MSVMCESADTVETESPINNHCYSDRELIGEGNCYAQSQCHQVDLIQRVLKPHKLCENRQPNLRA